MGDVKRDLAMNQTPWSHLATKENLCAYLLECFIPHALADADLVMSTGIDKRLPESCSDIGLVGPRARTEESLAALAAIAAWATLLCL
jgi:hypothetical protein